MRPLDPVHPDVFSQCGKDYFTQSIALFIFTHAMEKLMAHTTAVIHQSLSGAFPNHGYRYFCFFCSSLLHFGPPWHTDIGVSDSPVCPLTSLWWVSTVHPIICHSTQRTSFYMNNLSFTTFHYCATLFQIISLASKPTILSMGYCDCFDCGFNHPLNPW